MDASQPKRQRARDRVNARQQRRQSQVAQPARSERASQPRTRSRAPFQVPANLGENVDRARLLLHELWWRFTHTPQALYALGGVAALAVVIFLLSYVLGGRIFPNVWALGVDLSGMTVEEASARLQTLWQRELRIAMVDAEREWATTPAELGLEFDAQATAEAARGAGLAGIPFGFNLTPQVTFADELRAQTYLLDLSLQANIAPENAGYEWQGEELLPVAASEGKMMDVAVTLAALIEQPQDVVDSRRLELVMTPLLPDLQDATVYLEQAKALTSQQFQMQGYDPFTDELITWSTDRDTFTSWIEAGADGLMLRPAAFRPFLDAQARTLNTDSEGLRFIEPTEAVEKLDQAITSGSSQLTLRIRYRSTSYEVQRGDTGFRISRRTGIPFFLIQQANPGKDDWDTLSPGDIIQLPTRDLTLPLDPVPNKRIVVNLNTQSMIAYENGQPVFNWAISSGISTAPTSPGIYQIQSHEDVALGSSFTLCGDRGCGQWTMYWFMGIYEVVPGLMNGFHGAVELPDGTYLGGGNVGAPFTFGCVMSENGNAEQLFRWADTGTVVEVISSEFAPQSELGRITAEQTGGIAQNAQFDDV
jgi:LysM repeat protein